MIKGLGDINYKFENNKFMFRINNRPYKIGDKMFPVKTPNHIRVFTHENTKLIQNEALAQAIDELPFEMGRCYTNSERIVQLEERLGLPLKFYAGWLFVGDQFPLLHGWVVLGDDVIDTSLSQEETKIQRELIPKILDDPNWRDIMAKEIVKVRRKKLPHSVDGIFGQAMEHYVYVGCPDEKYRAAQSLFKIKKAFPNHPAPSIHDFDESGRTPMQSILAKHGY